MLKILYAASNSENSSIQLSRFLNAVSGKPYIIKVAAYKKSLSKNISIDWMLDSLIDVFNPHKFLLNNDNFKIYLNQIKYFNPDLIISDMEHYTSLIANSLDITLWQCSSSLINFALLFDEKYNVGLFGKYSYIFNRYPELVQRNINIIENSNCNLVYSHFGDLSKPPLLKEKFEWVRPYHQLGKQYATCKHNIVAASLINNKKVLSLLKNNEDCILFSNFLDEHYQNLLIKDINNEDEYFCNIANSNLFVCEGQTNFLADAFYNGKYTAVIPNFSEPECIINAVFSSHFKLSDTVYANDVDLNALKNKPITNSYSGNIKFLHERLELI